MTAAVPGIPLLPNPEKIAQQYTIPQDPRLFSGIASLLPNQSGATNWRNINLSQQAFRDPFQPDIASKVSSLHSTIISEILTGPQGYNAGAGPMQFDRAQALLQGMGGNYPTVIFGEPNSLNVFNTVLATAPSSNVFSQASQVPQNLSLFGYSSNVVPNLPFYMNSTRSASFLFQSGRSLAPFESLPGLIGPFNDPCGLTNALFSPLVVGIRLVNVLISELTNLVNSLLVAAVGALLSPIFGVLEQIQKIIQGGLETIAQSLGLNEAAGLVGQVLALASDPCIQFLLAGGGGFGQGMLSQPLKTALRIA
jgi:hypothetical protein